MYLLVASESGIAMIFFLLEKSLKMAEPGQEDRSLFMGAAPSNASGR